MPWDNSINKDIDDGILIQFFFTDAFKKNDDSDYPKF